MRDPMDLRLALVSERIAKRYCRIIVAIQFAGGDEQLAAIMLRDTVMAMESWWELGGGEQAVWN